MSLNWLYATRFRNLNEATLTLGPGVNLLFGENGSGKTSLLEAAYFLSSARSFRTILPEPLIQRGEPGCLVRGDLSHAGTTHHVGISRSRNGDRDIRINGETCLRSSDLARLLPTLVLGPESVALLTGPPVERRRFLNWGLFHVKHDFSRLWEDANRCLRQRNRLLREHGARQELESWSIQLAEHAKALDLARSEYVERYTPVFGAMVKALSNLNSVEFHYYRGWDSDSELLESYLVDLELDQKRGFTQKGFQRADVRIRVDGQPAAKVCSRGELKALVWAMTIAQGELTEQHEAHPTLYLIDDLASEFDAEHRTRLGRLLVDTGNQMLLTGVERQVLESCCDGEQQTMFHVKQGQVESLSP